MKGFPFDKLTELILQFVRKPLPYQTINILKAESSAFNGAIGAAIYAQQYQD